MPGKNVKKCPQCKKMLAEVIEANLTLSDLEKDKGRYGVIQFLIVILNSPTVFHCSRILGSKPAGAYVNPFFISGTAGHIAGVLPGRRSRCSPPLPEKGV